MIGMPSAASLTAILSALAHVLVSQDPRKLDDTKEGVLRNMNWILERRGEKQIQEGEILRQL